MVVSLVKSYAARAHVFTIMAAGVACNHRVVTVDQAVPEGLVAHHSTTQQHLVIITFGHVRGAVRYVLNLPEYVAAVLSGTPTLVALELTKQVIDGPSVRGLRGGRA